MTRQNAVPHRCLPCCEGMVDTDEGLVPNFYGRLVFQTDPPNPTCPNCKGPLVPVGETIVPNR